MTFSSRDGISRSYERFLLSNLIYIFEVILLIWFSLSTSGERWLVQLCWNQIQVQWYSWLWGHWVKAERDGLQHGSAPCCTCESPRIRYRETKSFWQIFCAFYHVFGVNVCIIPGGGSECRPQREEELCPSEAPSWPPAPQSVVASVPPTNYRDKDRLDRSCNLEAIRLISRSGFGVNIESCGMVAADGRRAFKLDVGVTIRPGSGSEDFKSSGWGILYTF